MAAAAQLSRLQTLASRAADALRSQVAPVVKNAYTDVMSRNAGVSREKRTTRGVS
jgi:hypothetical protein